VRKLLLPAAAVLAATLVAAGCGGTRASAPVASDHVTMVKSYRFSPDVVEVKAGDTVTWTNHDNFTHTVKVDGHPDHKVDRGDSFSIRFPKAGTYHYVCTLHSHDMSGTVVVT
jgi:plastocyanin